MQSPAPVAVPNPVVRPSRAQRLFALAIIAVALAILEGAHYVLDAGLWLGPEAAAGFRAVKSQCYFAWWCDLRLPQYFGHVLLAIAVAFAMFELAFSTGGGSERFRLENEERASLALRFEVDRWKRVFRWLLGASIGLSVLLAYVSVTAHNPPPLLWLAALIAAGGMFYCADKASGRAGLLSRSELLCLASFCVTLVVFGLAFRESWLHWPALGIGLLLAGVLWKKQLLPGEHAAFAAIVLVAFAVYTVDLTSWRYSWIGDEYNFFGYASNLLTTSLPPYLLRLRGTYDVHPVFASVVQSSTMLLYGRDVYGWRVSETMAVLLAALPLYVFMRTFLEKRAAILGLTVYLFSQHLLGITKVGYTYSQLLVPLAATLALMALALGRGSLLGVFLSGIAAAFAFYTFAFGIPFIVLPAMLFVLYYLPHWRSAFREWLIAGAALALGIAMTALPSLSDPEGLAQIAQHTVANTEVKAANNITDQVLPNWLYTLLSSLSFEGHSHYVSGPHLDAVSSILMILGGGALLVAAFRSRFALWLLLTVPLVAGIAGGFAPYPYPPIARTYILVPFYAIFAAIGLQHLMAALGRFAGPGRYLSAAWIVLLLAIPAANLYHFFVLTDRENRQDNIALLVKEFEEQPRDMTFYVVGEQLNFNAARVVLPVYGYDPNRLVALFDGAADTALEALKKGGPPYDLLIPWPEPVRDRWRTQMRSVWPDRRETIVSDASGITHFVKLVVPEGDGGVVARPTPAPIVGGPPFVVQPGATPRVTGQWGVERPRDVAVGPDGLIYVLNSTRKTIEVHSVDGKLVRTLKGNWQEPFALAFTPKQELLVLDSAGLPLITRLSLDGTVTADSGNFGLTSPRGMAVAPNGDVYLADTGGSRIVRLNPELLEPKPVTTTVRLDQPTSIGIVGDNLVVAVSSRLYVFSLTGELRQQWGISGYGTVQPPRFLANQTHLIVMTEPEPGQISVFDLDGNSVQVLGPPAYNQLKKPLGIAATSDGFVAIPELEGDSVRIINWGSR